MPTHRIKLASNISVVCMFIGFIVLPLLNFNNRLNFDPVPELLEKRTLAAVPTLELQFPAVVAFPRGFEAFYNDHIGFRNSLVRLNNVVKTFIFLESPIDTVAIGADGWLFYVGVGSGEDHRGLRPFTADQLRMAKLALEQRRDRMAALGARYYFVIVPNKQTIYPEYLTGSGGRVVGPTRLEQFVAYMRANSAVRPIDLIYALRAEKERQLLYFKTDSHWSDVGAVIGYHVITSELMRTFPTVRETPMSELEFSGAAPGDLVTGTGLFGLYPLEQKTKVQRTRSHVTSQTVEMADGLSVSVTSGDDPTLPSAVVVCDSFCDRYLRTLLAEHFRWAIFAQPQDVAYDPGCL